MSWTFDYSGSPLYAAQKNNHFAEQNLKVALQEGGFGSGGYIEPIDQVVNGKADFGLSSASTLIQARANGKPVVAIMSVLQRSPFALISLDKSHITQPKDLVGKKVAVNAGGANDVYLSFLKAQGIDPASVNTIPRTDFGIDPLLKGDVDVLAGWIINEGVMVEEAGQKPSYILPSDYGIESYDFVVFTTDDMVKNHPDVVSRFVKAVIAGTNDVIANSSQAVDYTLVYAPKLDKGQQQRRVDAMLALIHPAGSEVGMMDPKIWQTTYDITKEQGSLTKPVDLSSVYTLSFVNKVYNKN
jgi:NitT/TauT family transport system substrate-binding protein